MELNISDLLDDLQDTSVDIRLETDASARRIRELTMKKIDMEKQTKRKGLSTLLKIALVAALIASLSIPVVAATGFRFTDWIAGLAQNDRNSSLDHLTDRWEETEGFWQLGLTARDVTGEGMTLVCKEIQDTEVTGSLTMHGGYWLERWNGEKFAPMAATAEIPVEADREFRDGDSFEMKLDWANAYGSLEPGRYRLYKTFTYRFSDGKTTQLQDWAEFRIFNEDMTLYIAQIKAALDALQKQPYSHISWTLCTYDAAVQSQTAAYDFETWKDGGNYLLRRTEGGSWGQLLRNGEAFEINRWNEDNILSGVAEWEYDHLLSEELNNFEDWLTWCSIADTNVGEVWTEGNRIGLISVYYPEENDPKYEELVYTLDSQGNLVGAVRNKLPALHCSEEEKQVINEVKVHNTSAAEIAQVIAAQDVGTPDIFSWQEEKVLHFAGTAEVRTEGFNNTTARNIENGFDAFMTALADYEALAFHASQVCYDETEDIWKVEFWWKNGNIDSIVYLDGSGITQMTVTGPYNP